MENPNYYAIIPANVRYADIKPNAKLLYGEITALSNQKGYCWSTNNYFAELYGVSKNTISLWINQLKKHNFINVKVYRDEKKQVVKRSMAIIKNDDRYHENKNEGIIKNDEYNNIKNNITSNLSNRNEKFINEVIQESKDILERSQIEQFIDYWTETNKSRTLMRYEMEKTWNTNKRILRWKKNNEKWTTKKSLNGKSKISNAYSEWTKAKQFIEKQKNK
tara:strand:- start:3208 stop:3867 length:660 start_codon:yes stop_codon:yes gene_type:complete